MERKLLLLRSADIPEHISSPLTESGWSIRCIPVLQFEFNSLKESVVESLSEVHDYYVFPSQRSVDGINYTEISIPKESVWVSVGKATGKYIERVLGKTPEVIGTRGALEVVTELTTKYDLSGRTVAYLCGDNQATLPYELFREHSAILKEICCYRTMNVPAEDFKKQFIEAGLYHFIVFFSSSGVKFFAQSIGDIDLSSTQFVAIGTNTAKALEEHLGRCDFVPNESNLEGIRDLLLGL